MSESNNGKYMENQGFEMAAPRASSTTPRIDTREYVLPKTLYLNEDSVKAPTSSGTSEKLSLCVRSPDNVQGRPQNPVKKDDDRKTKDVLTDYLMALACPTQNPLKIVVEGYGASNGFPDRDFWRQQLIQEEILQENGGQGQRTYLDKWRTPDNSPFYHKNEMVRMFFNLGGYRAFPDIVTIEMDVREVFEIDCVSGTFMISFILTARWYDKEFDIGEFKDKEGTEVFCTSIPYITLDHVDYSIDGMNIPKDAVEVISSERHSGYATLRKSKDPPGVLYRSWRIQAKLRSYNNLKKFPYDIQTLKVEFRLWGATVRDDVDHCRVLLPINVELKLKHQVTEWTTDYPVTVVSQRGRGDRQSLEAAIHVKRKSDYFEFNIMAILCLIVSLSFTVQRIGPDDFASRQENLLTILLTSVAYKFFVADMLPKVPYLTYLDYYILTCVLLVVAVLVESTVIDKAEDEEFVEYVFFSVLAGVWVLVNVVVVIMGIVHRWFKNVVKYESDKEKDKKRKSNWFEFSKNFDTLRKRREYFKIAYRNYAENQGKDNKSSNNVHSYKESKVKRPEKDLSMKFGRCLCSACTNRVRDPQPIGRKGHLDAFFRQAKIMDAHALNTVLSDNLTRAIKMLERASISADILKKSYEGSAAELLDLLRGAGVNDGRAISAIMTAVQQAVTSTPLQASKLVVLQGSATYLAMTLFGEKETYRTRESFVNRCYTAPVEFFSTKTKKASEGDGEMDAQFLANCVFARVLLQTSAMKTTGHLIAQREFKSSNGQKVYSQLWAGYIAKFIDRNPNTTFKSILMVDVGTGELKFYHATYDDHGQINGIEVSDKDKIDSEVFLTKIRAAVIVQDKLWMEQHVQHHVQTDPNGYEMRWPNRLVPKKTIVQAEMYYELTDEEVIEDIFQELGGKLEEGIKKAAQIYDNQFDFNQGTKVLIAGTAGMRALQEELEPRHGARFTELIQALQQYIQWKLKEGSGGILSKLDVELDIVSHALEAESEYRAYVDVKKFAAPTSQTGTSPIEKLQQAHEFGNLAWGNGSCQALIDGKTTICVPMGLRDLQRVIVNHETVIDKTSKTVKFNSVDAMEDAMYAAEEYFIEELKTWIPATKVRTRGNTSRKEKIRRANTMIPPPEDLHI